MKKMKLRMNFVIVFIVFAIFISKAQIETVNGFNYYDINKDAFLDNSTCLNLTTEEREERQYYFTSFELAKTLDIVFNNTSEIVDTVLGTYSIQKRSFLDTTLGGEQFRWILLRPNDNIQRPTVHITHGGKTGGSSILRLLSLGVYDYVQRGYAVVFYQSGSTQNSLEALEDAGLQISCWEDSLYCSNWSPDCDMDCFQQAVYLKAQLVTAAIQFSASQSNTFNLDTDLFYSIGYSGSAVGVLTSVLTTDNNFDDPIFNGMGTIFNLSKDSTSTFELKAIKTLAGGFLDESSENYKIGPLTTDNVTNTRFMMIHGQDDWAVQPETSPLIWSIPDAQLPGSQIKGSIDLKSFFDDNNISNKAILNCSSGHTVFTHPCDFNDDVFGNNPQFYEALNGKCVIWAKDTFFAISLATNTCNISQYSRELFYVMDQIHDYSRIGAHFFHEDFPNSGPSSNSDEFINNLFSTSEVSAINPSSFPFNKAEQETNGHYSESDKCLQQTCTGLYFNRNGIGNNLDDLFGDFLLIPAYDTEIFNTDFTLELKFKAIKQTGIATLFSHLEDQLKIGFEIFINSNGYLIFKQNVIGQTSIVGNIDVLDGECHFVELTREGNEFALYLDGELQDIKKTFNVEFPGIPFYKVGNSFNSIGGLKGFNGIIRNIKFWDDARNPEFFMQTDISSNSSHLINEWTFDEKKGEFLVSTNYVDTIILGVSRTNFFSDPRWMKNDEMCECNDEQTIIGINNQTSNNEIFSIFPNPSNGKINIKFFEKDNLEKQLMVYNVQGKLISDKKTLNSFHEINIKNKGIYLLRIQNINQIKTEKLIIK